MPRSCWFAVFVATRIASLCSLAAGAPLPADPAWTYSAEVLQPFWQSAVVDGESILFIRDPATGIARGRLLFPANRVLHVTRAADWHLETAATFEPGRDYVCMPGSAEIILPAGSRVPSFTADELRRPAGSQKYRLTHRDGNGEILFVTDEYHRMQIAVTYERSSGTEWPATAPAYDPAALPRTTQRLQARHPLSIVLLGDSISTGCNASGWAGSAPWQPAWQDLMLLHLQAQSSPQVTLTNLAVGGTSTPWGITKVPEVLAAKPDLVLLAFGMNDSSGRPAAEFRTNIARMIADIRKVAPETEFILVASMLGNADWVTLKQDLFPAYRDALKELTAPGIALADLTGIWTEMLKRKQDADLTGNGVNHPNDFGHRVYAQTLTALLLPPAAPAEPAAAATTAPAEPVTVSLWPDRRPLAIKPSKILTRKSLYTLRKIQMAQPLSSAPAADTAGLSPAPKDMGLQNGSISTGSPGLYWSIVCHAAARTYRCLMHSEPSGSFVLGRPSGRLMPGEWALWASRQAATSLPPQPLTSTRLETKLKIHSIAPPAVPILQFSSILSSPWEPLLTAVQRKICLEITRRQI